MFPKSRTSGQTRSIGAGSTPDTVTVTRASELIAPARAHRRPKGYLACAEHGLLLPTGYAASCTSSRQFLPVGGWAVLLLLQAGNRLICFLCANQGGGSGIPCTNSVQSCREKELHR